MKRWLWYLAAVLLVAALGWMPFAGTDVAKLQPVEVIRVGVEDGLIRVETDTGGSGNGADLAEAFADLKASAAGTVFLETADYLLVSHDAQSLLEPLGTYLRPACGICLESGVADLETVADFLSTHEPGMTLQEYRAGKQNLPELSVREGRMYLVS